jgi:hypothetical protein
MRPTGRSDEDDISSRDDQSSREGLEGMRWRAPNAPLQTTASPVSGKGAPGLDGRTQVAPSVATSWTVRTDSFTFGALLTAFLLIVTDLSYLPVLTLGLILEHLKFGT